MTNEEKYKTAKERQKAFESFCSMNNCKRCPAFKDDSGCYFNWLDLEYEEELKPCPFCGCNEVKIAEAFTGSGHCVHCKRCDAKSGTYYVAENAVNAWNRRYKDGND